MRYDLADFEWSVIEPLLPMDRRGPKPKNNRQIINGMFYILRAGSPWRDLPERYGPYTTVYNRFNRWRKAGIWDRLMDAIVKAHDGKVQMIDSSIVWSSLCRSKPGSAPEPCMVGPSTSRPPMNQHTSENEQDLLAGHVALLGTLGRIPMRTLPAAPKPLAWLLAAP